jgi:hypothetical protein
MKTISTAVFWSIPTYFSRKTAIGLEDSGQASPTLQFGTATASGNSSSRR